MMKITNGKISKIFLWKIEYLEDLWCKWLKPKFERSFVCLLAIYSNIRVFAAPSPSEFSVISMVNYMPKNNQNVDTRKSDSKCLKYFAGSENCKMDSITWNSFNRSILFLFLSPIWWVGRNSETDSVQKKKRF